MLAIFLPVAAGRLNEMTGKRGGTEFKEIHGTYEHQCHA